VTVQAKICGIRTDDALDAALAGGAAFVGFVFFPRSPRNVTPEEAAALAARVPADVLKVAVTVDPDDAMLDKLVAAVPLDILQLHGAESPDRVAAIKARTGLQAMKALKIAGPDDVAAAETWFGVADRLLFDAKPPKDAAGLLPGGNALAFDWQLLAGRKWPCPWMLSGGLDAANVAEAVATSGAPAVDVSSGVESAPGVKDPARIAEFLSGVRGL
jgi:phosphoribosylanthranilate isomerase